MSDDVLLDLVDESEWQLGVRVDEEGTVDLRLESRCFGGWITAFNPPGKECDDGLERNTWWVTQEQVDDEGLPEVRHARALSVSELIDKVPLPFEIWIFEATERHIGYLESAEEFDDENAAQQVKEGKLLRAEFEQAKAHSETWNARFRRRYGDLVLYDFRDDATLKWERGEIDGKKTLLVVDVEFDVHDPRAYVAPDLEHTWRWTSARNINAAGEFLPVHEVLARVPEEHRGWVRRVTDEAYGEVVEAISALSARACVSDQPTDFAELARLAAHAEALAKGRDAEPFIPGH
jgi:hypothetical protein